LATIGIKNKSGNSICDLIIYGSYFRESRRECIQNEKSSDFDFMPLRKYNWHLKGDSFYYNQFSYEKIMINISYDGTRHTYQLEEIQEGECIELVIKPNKKLVYKKLHKEYHF